MGQLYAIVGAYGIGAWIAAVIVSFRWLMNERTRITTFLTIAIPGTAPASTAVLQYDKTLNRVGATVSLKAAEPNTTYDVSIGQPDDSFSCATVVASFTTNGGGNGTLNVSVPAVSTTARI